MSFLFNMPQGVAADYLEENGYPALAEFFREHSRPVDPSLHKTIDEHGHHGKIQIPGPKLQTIEVPYFTYASDMGSAKGKKKPTFYLGAKNKGYLYGTIKPELHKRLISELTGRTDLARELPNIPDTEFSPVKGLGGGLKSRFTSGEHTYEARFDKSGLGDHHIFAFEQLTAPSDQDEYGITGAGNAKHTLTQAAARFIHGLRVLKPKKVTFTAEEPSRVKLYNAMVKHIPTLAPDYTVSQDGGRYTVARKLELQRGWDGGDLGREDQEISGPEGWIDEDGNFHENQPGPYGVRHGDTLTRLGYKNVGEGIRAGLMHLASPDGSQLLGHRSDRQYTPKQLGTLKKLAAKHSLEPAITTTSNGTVTTRSLKLSKLYLARGLDSHVFAWITPKGEVHRFPWSLLKNVTHDTVAKKHGFEGAQGAFDAGWLRVAPAGDDELHGANYYKHPTDAQYEALSNLAMEHRYGEVSFGNPNKAHGYLQLAKETNIPHGWIDRDGKFYNNHDNPNGIASHYETLKHQLGIHDESGDYAKAHAQGLMHVSSIMGDLHGHHPKLEYTLPMLSTLKKLGKEHGLSSVSVTTKTNGKPGTRELKLSSVDRLWENIHKDPGARLVLADYLDENGEPEIAKFMRSNLTSHTSGYDYPSSSYGVVRPDKNQMYRGGRHDHPHIDRVMGGTSVIWLRTKHMEPRHYLQLEDLEPNQAHNLAKEISGKLELAAEKAPAGGMVSNNQFYEGGKFLPRALKSIREVRNRKLSKQKTKGTKVMGAPEKLMSPE